MIGYIRFDQQRGNVAWDHRHGLNVVQTGDRRIVIANGKCRLRRQAIALDDLVVATNPRVDRKGTNAIDLQRLVREP